MRGKDLESLHNSLNDFYGPQNTQNDAENFDRMSRITEFRNGRAGTSNGANWSLPPFGFAGAMESEERVVVGSPDFKQALLERLHGENQMNKEKWTKLWYDPYAPMPLKKRLDETPKILKNQTKE